MTALLTTPVRPSRPARPMPVTTSAPAPLLWTRQQFQDLGDSGFFEGRRALLIRGVIYEEGLMNGPHATGLTLTQEYLSRLVVRGRFVRGQQPLAVGADTAPLPDFALVSGSARDYTADHPTPAQTLLVVEVADSSLQFDLTTKAELYAEAGIAEYWVLDVENRELHVLRSPAALPPGGFAYQTVTKHAATDSVAPLAAPTSPVLVSDLLP